jgi:hypothetical protein
MNTPLLARLFSFLLVLLAAPAAWCQAPALPDGLAEDPRLTWRPALNPSATVTLDRAGVITNWRSGSPVVVPAGARDSLVVALEQLKNNAGEWLGIEGRHGSVALGDKVDANEAARPEGFQGISIVGLDQDPASSDCAVLAGFMLSQRIGLQRDVAFLNLTIDSWSDRPCMTIEGADESHGNLYLENVRGLAISNDRKGQTAKGDRSTKWFFKLHGAWRIHFLRFALEDGVDPGDGLAGTNEHGVYLDGLLGDSEVLDSTFTGCKISALYTTTRFQNRIVLANGSAIERFSFGAFLIDNLFAHDCGVLGSWAVNVCGGVQEVLVRNMHYRVNLDGPALAKWAGGAVQVYVDNKQFELDTGTPANPIPVSSQSVPKALGYSLETKGGLPMSQGIQALVDSGALPWDGYGGARRIRIEGGLFEGRAIYPPLFNFRDVLLVELAEAATGPRPFKVSGVGKTAAFAASGQMSQCGPAHNPAGAPGRLPAALGAGWNQQAVFFSRRLPSTWFGQVKINGTAVAPADLDTWKWQE